MPVRYYLEFDDEGKTKICYAGEPRFPLDTDIWESRPSQSVIARVNAVSYAEIGTGYIGISTQADEDYLSRFCAEIPEEEARLRHPELFMFLYQNNIIKKGQ